MKYIKIEKKCPYCPDLKSIYTFKTFHGLRKHVFRWHLRTMTGKNWNDCGLKSDDVKDEPAFIRVYTRLYSTHYDISVNGVAHIEALLRDYCEVFNPSLRGIK